MRSKRVLRICDFAHPVRLAAGDDYLDQGAQYLTGNMIYWSLHTCLP